MKFFEVQKFITKTGTYLPLVILMSAALTTVRARPDKQASGRSSEAAKAVPATSQKKDAEYEGR